MSVKVKLDFLDEGEVELSKCSDKRYGNGFNIRYTAMYEAPPLNLYTLKAIGDHFGTTFVDVHKDSIDEPGCESCDYWSCYGHDIRVYKATQNIPFFE